VIKWFARGSYTARGGSQTGGGSIIEGEEEGDPKLLINERRSLIFWHTPGSSS